jgi:type IV pilus assembly protein PilY1
VVGERRGGTHYFALDITDATKLEADADPFEFPKFLWMYPQPDDRRSLSLGETYTDFLPVPPPVGPVRIKASTVRAKTPSFGGTPFNEKWIAFLSGGFDQQYVRGRGVHMVDVWTGHSYWDFAYPESSAGVPATDPRLQLRYPIPATVGMVMWGPGSRRENGLGYANAGFFDTATFGDTGGQLWTLRFHLPGELDSNGKVTNWYGARAFQMGGATDASLGWAHPFFYITANTALPGDYIYRAYLGTGDRFNLLDKGGGECGPGNIRACAMRGCTVQIEAPSNFSGTPELGKVSGSQAETAKGSLASSSAVAGGGTTVETKAKIVVSGCPSPESGAAAGFTKEISVSCEQDGAGRWGCEKGLNPTLGEDLLLSNAANVPVTRNWYFSVKIFDDAPNARIPFSTAAQARAYDDARLWIRDTGAAITQPHAGSAGFSVMAASAQNPATSAGPSSDGWAIYYDHGPSSTVEGKTYSTFATDERTSSVSGLFGIVTWNSTQPVVVDTAGGTTGSCFRSKCASGAGEEPRLAYHYAAHPLTGQSVLQDETGTKIRSRSTASYVPAQGDQPTIFVNQKGQVLVGMTVVNPNKGARSVATGDPSDAVKDLGWIEVSEPVHACRHAQARPAAGVCR